MVTRSSTGGHLEGTSGADVLTGIAQEGTNQIHIYAQSGDDVLNLEFADITRFSHGHHVRGEYNDATSNLGRDTFNFAGLDRVDDIVVGRIEDFDAMLDSLSIHGVAINHSQLHAGFGTTAGYSWRIVEYDVDTRDSLNTTQQWLLIDTGPGFVFYALEAARATNGDGAANGGNEEAHFVGTGGGHVPTASELESLVTVKFEPPDPSEHSSDTDDHTGHTDHTGHDTHHPSDTDPKETPLPDSIAQSAKIYDGTQNIKVLGATNVTGSGSGDLVTTTSFNDVVYSQNGNDRVVAGAGNDLVYGGSGDDFIVGGDGDDKAIGGSGDDRIHGDVGNDTLNGWGGEDMLFGGLGDDRVFGQEGDDLLNGGIGHDRMFGGHDSDELYGGSGNDLLAGGQDADTIRGGSGADVFEFKTGDLVDWDTLSGTTAQKNAKLDIIRDFGTGADKIRFSGYDHVDSLADLRSWKSVINGDTHFSVEVRHTGERVLVNVPDTMTYAEFFNSTNFDFV